MHTIDTAAGRVVADDTQASVEAIDQAVMSLANLCSSIVEVSRASRLPIGTAQTALANTGEGLAKLIASRDDMSRATFELVQIQKGSNLQTVSFGCPGGFPTAEKQETAPRKQSA